MQIETRASDSREFPASNCPAGLLYLYLRRKRATWPLWNAPRALLGRYTRLKSEGSSLLFQTLYSQPGSNSLLFQTLYSRGLLVL